MPRIDVTLTRNLRTDVDSRALVTALHDAAVSLGCFPTYGIRVYASFAEFALIGDANSERGYVQVDVRAAPGRSEAMLLQILDTFESVVRSAIASAPRHVRYQIDLTEFDTRTIRAGGSL